MGKVKRYTEKDKQGNFHIKAEYTNIDPIKELGKYEEALEKGKMLKIKNGVWEMTLMGDVICSNCGSVQNKLFALNMQINDKLFCPCCASLNKF